MGRGEWRMEKRPQSGKCAILAGRSRFACCCCSGSDWLRPISAKRVACLHGLMSPGCHMHAKRYRGEVAAARLRARDAGGWRRP